MPHQAIRSGTRSTSGIRTVEELYLFGADHPDTWVDISEFIDRKRDAIMSHLSQAERGNEVAAQLLAWNRTLGQERGVSYAESFKVLRPHCEICR